MTGVRIAEQDRQKVLTGANRGFRPSRVIAAFWLMVLISGLVRAQGRGRIDVKVEPDGSTFSLSAVRKGDVTYASLQELADLCDIKTFANPENRKLVLRVGSKAVKVTRLNPFVLVDDIPYQLALSTEDVNGELYVPLVLFINTLDPFLPQSLTFDEESRVLRIGRVPMNITGMEVEEKENGILIHLITTRDFSDADLSTSMTRGWLYVTVVGGILDSASVASSQRIGPIKRIVPFQFENSAQISFLIDGDITDSKAYPEKGGVLVSLRSARAIDITQAYEPMAEYRKFLIDRIVIDPGHGGKHPGAVGRSGLQEKDVNLEIARRLKKLLSERLAIEVLLTREGDEFVGLKERTQFANSRGGKLFISIHQNGNDDKRVRGYSMYLLGREKTKQALEVAQKENSVIELEESKEAYEDYKNASYILNAIAQNQYVKESEDLAQMVGSALGRGTRIPRFGEGVYQAGLYVLIGAAMPSILVETAFITNSEEERLLRTKSFLQKIAESLCNSVVGFKEKYERGIKQQTDGLH